MGRELTKEKFLNDIADCASANCDQRILEGERRPVAILRRDSTDWKYRRRRDLR